jgi:hypothetical protein
MYADLPGNCARSSGIDLEIDVSRERGARPNQSPGLLSRRVSEARSQRAWTASLGPAACMGAGRNPRGTFSKHTVQTACRNRLRTCKRAQSTVVARKTVRRRILETAYGVRIETIGRPNTGRLRRRAPQHGQELFGFRGRGQVMLRTPCPYRSPPAGSISSTWPME